VREARLPAAVPTRIGTIALLLCAFASSVASSQEPGPKTALQTFAFTGVTLDGGVLRQQLEEVREYYLRIPNDDLLRPFRARKGLPAPGALLGGWYAADVFSVFGQIVSGLARAVNAVRRSRSPALRRPDSMLCGDRS
jgi:hypothetical protein